ncbi:hypothetical protein FRC02_005820 [Tulasnella sp. 418]|nr:hypothetical protein FRC02_005820 [Tulasnella sp. 418]
MRSEDMPHAIISEAGATHALLLDSAHPFSPSAIASYSLTEIRDYTWLPLLSLQPGRNPSPYHQLIPLEDDDAGGPAEPVNAAPANYHALQPAPTQSSTNPGIPALHEPSMPVIFGLADAELDDAVANIIGRFPDVEVTLLDGIVRSLGHQVPQDRLQQSLARCLSASVN